MTRAFFVVASLLATGPAFAIANPASEFCVKMGGRLDIVKDKTGGEIGLCYLPDGRIIEEWTLFRMYDGKVP